jgi:uncharacterized protein
MFFDKKAKEVEKSIIEHADQVGKTILELQVMMKDYCQKDKHFKQESYEIHLDEHEADKIRRRIGIMLYEGAFLPIYREDYFKLVEMVDKIANQSEAIGDFTTLTRPQIPDFIEPEIHSLIELTIAIFEELKIMIKCFLDGDKTLMKSAVKIRELEQAIDKQQFYMTRTLFKSNLEKIEKLHTKDLIDGISKISNLVEDVADQFEIIAAKNRL